MLLPVDTPPGMDLLATDEKEEEQDITTIMSRHPTIEAMVVVTKMKEDVLVTMSDTIQTGTTIAIAMIVPPVMITIIILQLMQVINRIMDNTIIIREIIMSNSTQVEDMKKNTTTMTDGKQFIVTIIDQVVNDVVSSSSVLRHPPPIRSITINRPNLP